MCLGSQQASSLHLQPTPTVAAPSLGHLYFIAQVTCYRQGYMHLQPMEETTLIISSYMTCSLRTSPLLSFLSLISFSLVCCSSLRLLRRVCPNPLYVPCQLYSAAIGHRASCIDSCLTTRTRPWKELHTLPRTELQSQLPVLHCTALHNTSHHRQRSTICAAAAHLTLESASNSSSGSQQPSPVGSG